MKLSATWEGPLPGIGSYLKAPKGRSAYRVCGVHVISEGTIDRGEVVSITTRATFFVERIKASDVPSDATVHAWRWVSRAPTPKRIRP